MEPDCRWAREDVEVTAPHDREPTAPASPVGLREGTRCARSPGCRHPPRATDVVVDYVADPYCGCHVIDRKFRM